ncbi:TonB-dependent receptor [Siphonobacter sp. SORGH_AS_0500]|uniref:SusC/RagA family TonB-linked outer membrane protein n=1 Tax=Siphonobacter sp. SORGH_AS_0500 TaxID=1864824 RepID=UPI0028607219|nr:TonB-dependent receptor [Siphonobacter sp. SORGH_AS_0500]MDR6197389.1 TonB-linked SusC/RagA family outer membrane protein [Siphonobacter sp. SORGH_AS_0500]
MMRKFTLLLSLISLMAGFLGVAAQGLTVTGKVTAKGDGAPLVGVSVLVQGTTTGATSDVAGNYRVTVPGSEAVLIFSQVGMKRQTITVGNRTQIDVVLEEDAGNLDEVVVVGYGAQKKSVVTGAISSVKASDLATMPITRVDEALQGRASGLTITQSSGQPGSNSSVRVRGLTTLNNNDPLWVIDGVVVDNGGIGYLNQSDIESIEVLKDAASQAIYGARAAAGVILVTTKKGKAGSIQVSYNGFYGVSSPAKKLNLLNASQYATIRNESLVNAGRQPLFANPESLGQGTDWQSVIFNNSARRQNHELSISGGSEKSTFYLSLGYIDQEGIVATPISKYNRLNIRLNSTHKLAKWLTFGQNLGYGREKNVGLGNTNSEFGGPLSSAINLDPLTPTVITDPTEAAAAPYTNTGIRRDANGRPYGISRYVAQEITNPLAYMQTRLGNYGWSDNIVGNAYLEAEPIKGLKLRSTLGAKLSFWGSESFSPLAYLNATTITSQTSFSRVMNRRLDYNLENTISYTRDFDRHNFSVLVGQGAYQDNNTFMNSVTFYNIPADNFDDASLNYKRPTDQRSSDGSEGALHRVSSLFARVNYSYDEKYLVQALIRRDGSSRFGANNKYGVFPSLSLGWVLSREAFFPEQKVVNFFKLRGGYGVVGNDAIGDFAYLSTIGSGRNYAFGNSGTYLIGYSPNAPANPDLRWEQTTQTNIGFDATLFNNVSMTLEWFKKVTTDVLQNPRIPGYVGAISNPAANVADIQNQGIELELGYKKKFGDFNFSLNGNVSYIKNKVTNLGRGIEYLSGGQSFQASSYPITRTAVGQPINAFYGFQTMGIFQNQGEVESYTNADGKVIQPNAKPGDFRWADLNGDGQINEDDRTFLGNPTPTVGYGFTLNLGYKNFDFVLFGQGATGNKIFQGLRRLDIQPANYQTSVLGRWTGEGSTNDYPRIVEGDPNKNFLNPSNFYLEDGGYFRIKTLQLGYTIPKTVTTKIGMQRARIYVMSQNLLTLTNYSGYDPEIGGGVTSIDRGIYPQARSFMLGLNLGF